jgi:bis(5'-nucleosyl)-tetraphosphatase (symmetrical)
MATYAVGDVHGCFLTFQELLDKIAFDPRQDRLWLTGDIVGKGARPVEMLSWCREHEHAVTMVLGNNEIWLFRCAEGLAEPTPANGLLPILEDAAASEHLAWLCRRPLLHAELPFVLVHAGLFPQWSIETAALLAAKLQAILNGPRRGELLLRMPAKPVSWSPQLNGMERMRAALTGLTCLRVCTPDGQTPRRFFGPPEQAPENHAPWYELRGENDGDAVFLFGHWAALGLRKGRNFISLDSGCVYGKTLSAVRLEDGRVFQVQNTRDRAVGLKGPA